MPEALWLNADNISGKSKEWKCSECSYKNKSPSEICAVCGHTPTDNISDYKKKKRKVQEYDVIQEESDHLEDNFERNETVEVLWTCRKCTLHNPMSTKICLVCETPIEVTDLDNDISDNNKPSTSSDGIRVYPSTSTEDLNNTLEITDDGETWQCKKCTFINNNVELCKVCNYPNPDNISNDIEIRKKSSSSKRSIASVKHKSILVDELRQIEEIAALETRDRIIEHCNRNNETFIDDSFPPAAKSLYLEPSSNKHEITQWLRPHELKLEDESHFEWCVFRKPVPSDISQGILGDCWFLSSLAVLASREDLVKRIIITRDFNKHGLYHVRLCNDGKWTTILIDDHFPCDKYGRLAYSKAKGRQLWVPLIEKAAAKMYGCYEALVSGRAIQGLSILTGAPCESIDLQPSSRSEEFNLDIIWARLLSSHTAGFLMGISCGGNHVRISKQEFEKMGLKPDHAYSLLELKDTSGHRLMRLRNPWGRYSWKGAWSDDSSLWTPKLKRELLPNNSSEGIFWIAFNDVVKYFSTVDICKVRPGWSELRLFVNLPPSVSTHDISCTVLNLHEATELDIMLIQEGERKKTTNQLNLCVAIYRVSSSEFSTLGNLVAVSKGGVKNSVCCGDILEPGCYAVVCMSFNHSNFGSIQHDFKSEFVLAIHSSKRFLVEQLSTDACVIADAIINFAIARGSVYKGVEGMTSYTVSKEWAGLIIVVENRHTNKWIHVTCECEESRNVVSTRGVLTTADSVPPKHRQVIILLSQLVGGEGFSTSYHLTHRLSNSSELKDWGNGTHKPPIGPRISGLHLPRPIK